MLACNKGFVDIARLLLEHGANIDNQSKVRLCQFQRPAIHLPSSGSYLGGLYSIDGSRHEWIN